MENINKYKQIDFSKAMSDIKKMLLDTHEIKQIKSGYNYKGEEITHFSVLATSYNIKDSVKQKNVKYEAENQGRDFLDIILAKVFQLGYNQAAIIEGNKHEPLYAALALLTNKDK